MENKNDKRKKRSLDFFEAKKCGKYKRRKGEDDDNIGNVRETLRAKISENTNRHTFCINFILTGFSLILADKFANVFPSALKFLTNVKRTFVNSKIIMFTHDKAEIISTKKSFSCIDIYVELNNDSIVTRDERPVVYLRKFLANRVGPAALTGPFVLLTNSMNAYNNKQYDIVKDIRRFYIFDNNNVLRDVDHELLTQDVKKSVKNFLIPQNL